MKKIILFIFMFSINALACDSFEMYKSAENLVNIMAKARGAQTFRMGPSFWTEGSEREEFLYSFSTNSGVIRSVMGQVFVNINTCIALEGGSGGSSAGEINVH